MLFVIYIICSFIVATVGIVQSYRAKKEERGIFGLTRTGAILVTVAIVGLGAAAVDTVLAERKSKQREREAKEKLVRLAHRADNATMPILMFLSAFLSANGMKDPISIFREDYEDEPGENRPAPALMDPIMDVFARASLFETSNMTIGGRDVSWLESFSRNLRQTNHECDLLIRHYGGVNHHLVVVIDVLRDRSETLLFLMDFVANYPGARELWEDGISHEQHLDFFRHFFLRVLKARQLTRIILGTRC